MTAIVWLTLDDVTDRTALSRSEIKRLVANGEFPSPSERSDGSHIWREADIDQWIESRPRVTDDYRASVRPRH